MEDIERTLNDYREFWSRLDFAALRNVPAPLFDSDGIEGYWTATRGATRCIRIETWNLMVQRLAPSVYFERCFERCFERFADSPPQRGP